MLSQEVKNYISTAKGLPFFYVVGDENYQAALDDLTQAGLSIVRMSDFCPKADKFPSVDELVDYFRTSDVDYRDNKFVVIGLGEYLALRGAPVADKELRRLKNTTLGNARAILLLRGVAAQASKIISDDNRIIEQHRAFVSGSLLTNISITNVMEDVAIIAQKGIKPLLRTLEDGASSNTLASSSLLFDASLFPVTPIKGSYLVIKLIIKDFDLESNLGTEEQWGCLLKDLIKCQMVLDDVFVQYGIDDHILDDLYYAVTGVEYKNWLVFLYLKSKVDTLRNEYLRAVIDSTEHFDDLRQRLLTYIVSVSHKDSNFKVLYNARKKLLKGFPEEDIAVFIRANEVEPEDSIYRLTDNTLLEKKAIIKWVARHGICEAVSEVYPGLNDYLRKYIFNCPVLADELTQYFDLYKRQKITNQISTDFIALVEKYANSLAYAQLPTRDNAIKAIPDKSNAYLYWIDALGVEYLSFITALAKKKGLSIHIDIVRSDLPTITSVNKQFYEQWSGGKKYKEDQLDNIKHKEKGGYFFTEEEDPIHLPAELMVIEKAINLAAMELGMHKCRYFVIASDHGASRLAVIKKQEIQYDTDTKGEHSGRCCKFFEGCEAPFYVEDNGFIALSDYGRFRGSRQANVEVHGGASLEEIVVPVITLTLKKQSNAQITVMHPNEITADRHEGVTLQLYISAVESMADVSIVIEDRSYQGKTSDGLHFTFLLKEIKRAKTKPYTADVFDSSDLIGTISFKVKGKTATVKDDFNFDDDEF